MVFNSIGDDDDYNIVVKVKSEMASQNINRPVKRIIFKEMRNRNSDKLNHRLDGYDSQRHNGFGSLEKSKYQPKSNSDKNYKFDREQKNIGHSSQSNNYDQNILRDEVIQSKKKRWDDIEYRLSEKRSERFRNSRSPETSTRYRSSNNKEAERKSKRSRSYDRSSNKSSSDRGSTPRKRRRKSPSSFDWNRLGSRHSPDRNLLGSPYRKKERTPASIESERELVCFTSGFTGQENVPENQAALISPQQLINQTYNILYSSGFPPLPNIPKVNCNMPLLPMPAVSVNNLPLVPGPTGLPVYITTTGEQIPHDMDGRPIPFGPNGFYLPVDPTGRIFAHIVSPDNQAIPIHMKEDGILRLPNSEPVPYGPGHQLPVNIDGRVIFIGPDSRPLYPCHNLPKEPPFILLEMMVSSRNKLLGQRISNSTELSVENRPQVQTKTVGTQTENQVKIQSSYLHVSPLNRVQNLSEQVSKSGHLENHKDKAQEKSEDIKCEKIKKNLSFSPKSGLKTSTPTKLTQKKIFKEDSCDNCSGVVLDSGEADSVLLSACKSERKPKKGSVEVIIDSDDDGDALEIICDKEVPKANNDFIVKKVQRAIKLLSVKNQNLGRFIVADFSSVPPLNNSPNESPLLRNRIQLSFHTPNPCVEDQLNAEEKPEVNFRFLPQKNNCQNVEMISNDANKNSSLPVLDSTVQCDMTSETIKTLKTKVSSLEMEISKLKTINANLLEKYRSVQTMNQEKSGKLKKVLFGNKERKNEQILTSKHSFVAPK